MEKDAGFLQSHDLSGHVQVRGVSTDNPYIILNGRVYHINDLVGDL